MLMIYTPDARSLKTGLRLMDHSLARYLSIPVMYFIDFLVGLAGHCHLYYFFRRHTWPAIPAASDDEWLPG